ncbi:MAG: PIN domain-containing protein [Thermoproteota archaeon]
MKEFASKLAKADLVIPSIVAIELIKIDGSRIGKDSAKIKLRLWIKGEARVLPIGEDVVFEAGEISLQHKKIPLADIIIGAVAR